MRPSFVRFAVATGVALALAALAPADAEAQTGKMTGVVRDQAGQPLEGAEVFIDGTHVPLMLKLPGSRDGGTRVAEPVGLGDVVPTIAGLLDLRAPPLGGTSLLAPGRWGAVYGETYYPRSVFVDDPKGRAFIEQVVPVGRLARPDEIGELVRFLASAQGTFMTGAVIDFSGGWPAAPERPA